MAFYGYQGNPYESNWTPTPYDFPVQSSSEYSAYEFSDPNLSEYYSAPSYNYSYYACTPPEHNLIQYYPQTSYLISYSNSEPTEPEIEVWEEYDPTPYGGGYDITQTYGKPLPESDQTCYPRSPALDPALVDGFSYDSQTYQKPEPIAEENVEGGGNGKSGILKKVPTAEENVKGGGNGNGKSGIPKKVHFAEDVSESADHPSSENDQESNREGPNIVPYSSDIDQEWSRPVPNAAPYGSGLESLDICESVFGYWPCLEKMEREKKACRACEDSERRRYDPWEVTANYLFGSPFPYDDRLQNGGNGSSFQHQNLYTESQYY